MPDKSITLPDPSKLRLLAKWFDEEDKTFRWGPHPSSDVQDDLRLWAKDIEVLRDELMELHLVMKDYPWNDKLKQAVEKIIVKISY